MDLTFNLSSILDDPETFPNPTKFDPERFLGDLGRVRTQRMIPFGIGEFFFFISVFKTRIIWVIYLSWGGF